MAAILTSQYQSFYITHGRRQLQEGEKNQLFGLQVELCGEGVTSSQPFHGPAIGLDVDDVTDLNALFLQSEQIYLDVRKSSAVGWVRLDSELFIFDPLFSFK